MIFGGASSSTTSAHTAIVQTEHMAATATLMKVRLLIMSVMLRVQKRNTSLHVRHWDSSNASSIETPSLICEQDGFFFAKNTLNLSLNPFNRSKTAFVPAPAFVFKHVQPTREEPWRCTAGSLQPKASQQRQPTEVRIDPKSHAGIWEILFCAFWLITQPNRMRPSQDGAAPFG